MNYSTICRNPYCMEVIHTSIQHAKFYCNTKCRVQAHRFWKGLSGEERSIAEHKFKNDLHKLTISKIGEIK